MYNGEVYRMAFQPEEKDSVTNRVVPDRTSGLLFLHDDGDAFVSQDLCPE